MLEWEFQGGLCPAAHKHTYMTTMKKRNNIFSRYLTDILISDRPSHDTDVASYVHVAVWTV